MDDGRKDMKTAHRIQSHAKRRWQADPFALWKVVANTTGFNDAEQVACTLPVRLVWQSIITGDGTPDDLQSLADVVGICIIASQNMDALVQETCDAARIAVCAIADRYTRIKKIGVDSAALRDVPPLLDFYEELLRLATGGQMAEWLHEVRKVKARVM